MTRTTESRSPIKLILGIALIVIGVYIIFYSGPSTPKLPVVTDEMSFCQTDSDCQIITTPHCCSCPLIALNASFASKTFESQRKQYCDYAQKKDGGVVCLAIYCGNPNNATATCVDNKCKATANDLPHN